MLGHWHAGLLFEKLGSIAAIKVMSCEGLVAMLVLAALWWRTPVPAPAGSKEGAGAHNTPRDKAG